MNPNLESFKGIFFKYIFVKKKQTTNYESTKCKNLNMLSILHTK